jgi:hypothetical protein
MRLHEIDDRDAQTGEFAEPAKKKKPLSTCEKK